MVNKYLIGILVLVLLTASIYILIPNNVRIDVGKTYSTFKVWENDSWVLAGQEYTLMFDGTTKMRASSRKVEQFIDGEIVKIIRTANFKDNVTVIDTYTFDGNEKDIELFPISHDINVVNGEGYILVYEVTKLEYSGKTVKDILSPQEFGHNMKVSWEVGNYYSRIWSYANRDEGKLTIKYRPSSANYTKQVRLFDPPSVNYNVDFEFSKNSIIEKCLDIQIQNLQDSSDELNLKTILNETNFDINKVNIKFSEWKSEEVLRDTYETICYPYNITEINGTSQIDNCTQIVTGNYTEEVWDWQEKQLIFTDKEGKKELKNTWEQIPIQKAGNKDTVKFRLCFDVPIEKTNSGWGNAGTIYLDVNGELFVDKTHSSWWNSNWDKKRLVTITGDNGDLVFMNLSYSNFSSAQADFDDIRFVNSAEDTEFGYFLQSKIDSNSAKFKINTTGDTSFYIYSDNAGASSNSNIENVYGTNTVSLWGLDGTAGTVNDSLGLNNGTNDGATRGVTGMFDNAFSFDGTNDNVTMEHSASLDITGTAISTQTWVYWDGSADDDHLVSKVSGTGIDGWYVRIDSVDTLEFRIGTTAYDSNGLIPQDVWTHIVTTYDGSDMKIYINGELNKTGAKSGAIPTNGYPLILGMFQTGYHYLAGDMDDVIIWDRSLNPGEVKAYSNMTEPTFTFGTEETTDVEYPQFSNYWDDNATLTDSGTGNFNVTIINTNGTVLLEIDGNNITATNLTADVYNASYVFSSDGNYNYSWHSWGNGTNENYNTSEVQYYTVNATPPDLEYPIFSDYKENPANNTVYSFGAEYRFNSTIIQANGTAEFEIAETNYSSFNSTGTMFNTTIADLSAGTHSYYWWAYGNGTSTNYNTSEARSYTIAKAVPTGSLTSNLGWTINETQEVNIGLSESNDGDGDVTYIVFRDNVSKGTGETWYPVYGTYNYVLNTTGGTNWTANLSMDIQILTVNDITNPEISIIYPSNNSNHSSNTIEINYTVSDTNLQSCWYSNDTYSYNYSLTNCANITGVTWSDGQHNVTVWANDSANNQNSSSVTFNIDTTSPYFTDDTPQNQTIIYNTALAYNINATDIIGFDCFTINDTRFKINCSGYLENNTRLGVALYNLNVTINDTSNNLNSSYFWINVTQSGDTFDILLNNAVENLTVTYPQQVNVSVSNNLTTATIDVNGTTFTSGSNYTLGFGVWFVNVTTAGNQNYTTNESNWYITVNPGAGEVYAWINHTRANFSSSNRTDIWLNATLNAGVGDIELRLNGSIINSGSSPLSNLTNLSYGFYNLTAVYPGNANYTLDREIWWINITEPIHKDFNITITKNTSFDFIPDNGTHQGVEPINQTGSVGIFTAHNNLTNDISIWAKLNNTNADITLKICNSSTYSNSISINTSYQILYGNLSVDSTIYLWAWADYNNPLQPWFPELEIKGVFI